MKTSPEIDALIALKDAYREELRKLKLTQAGIERKIAATEAKVEATMEAIQQLNALRPAKL